MTGYTSTPETKFYNVKSNLEFEELANPTSVEKTDDLIAVLKITVTTIRWRSPSGYDKSDSTRDIEILRADLTPLDEFQNNSWKFKISHLISKDHHGNKIGFAANFIDALEIPNTTEEFYIQPQGFISAYKRFLALSQYTGYRIAVVQLEKAKLLEENMLLKEEIVKLKGDVARLTEKLSYLA